MDPLHSAQDVLRCTLCKTELALLHCNVCHTHLCKDCVVIHFSNKSQAHNVVPIEQFLSTLSYPKCPDHPTKQCELHCKQCDIPICASCVSSRKHFGHDIVDIFEDFKTKKEILKKDLQEIENSIVPKYEEAASNIQIHKADQRKNSQKLTAELKKHGEALHKEIDIIIQGKQAEIEVMESKHQAALDKQEDAINNTVTEMKQVILDLKSLLDTCNVSLVSKYQSRIEEFRKMPHKLKISLPTFQPVKVNREHIMKQFGSIIPLSLETEEQGYTVPSPGAKSSPPDRPLLDVPQLITELDTAYKYLYGVSCLGDEEIWTLGEHNTLKLYNMKGELLKSVQTKSGNGPADTAVTRSRGLLFVDWGDRSINLVIGTQIQTLITLRGWRPRSVCTTLSGDLLVSMDSDDKQSKVVRYSGSTEKQSIHRDDQGNPLYTSGNIKYLSENRNLDICVADCRAGAVVVVSAAGKLRFRYTGPSSTPRGSFYPRGITTDSRANILTSDYDKYRIHIIDQDGHFLHYIDNCSLQWPWGLCVDSRDNLFVAEAISSKPVKVNREQIMKQFGSTRAESSSPNRPLLDVPQLLTELDTGYESLYGLSCLSDEEIWTRGEDKNLKLYNLRGELMKSVRSKSGNVPQDIAVTRSGGLLYTDYRDSSINLVSGKQIQTLIKLQGWNPRGVCSTSSEDLLVIMYSDDKKQSKVLRYSGSTEKQAIQWDDQRKPLYTSGGVTYLSENRNLDICVADNDARAVVVVSAAGKLRFRYTGPPSTPRESFDLVGITTDSQANILTSDLNNHSIHIIDQVGRFLRYIDNCGLQLPWGLCVDSRDNLFVAEFTTCKVKKIQYYQ
ncbi:uncharacterized protein LOC111132646 [Crassostrea virginica]